jgi:hypothetical protein
VKTFFGIHPLASIKRVPPWRNRKNGLHLLSRLVSFFLLFCLFSGCANGVFRKQVSPVDKWTCNREADAAAIQGDYETGIALHQRFLEKDPDNGLALYLEERMTAN